MKLKRSKIPKKLHNIKWTKGKKYSEKTGGGNNSDHDCM